MKENIMGENVNIYYTIFQNTNILKVEAGTNCPQGGDGGHGGTTVFGLDSADSTQIFLSINNSDEIEVENLKITLFGDSECETFISALNFALSTFKASIEKNKYRNLHKILRAKNKIKK